jgi:type VI secretion system secreted protein Hcp
MAIRAFLELKDIAGEALDQNHADQIQVISFAWGTLNAGTFHDGPNLTEGSLSVQDLTITKYVDKSTPNLVFRCVTGQTIEEGTLYVQKSGGNDYLVLIMKPILITSVSVGAGDSSENTMETCSLNFREFEYKYSMWKDDGTLDSAVTVKGDIPAGKESFSVG